MAQGLADGVDLKTYCKMLPKIELHAHLNGSLSDTTILRLLQDKRSAGVVNLPDSAEVVIKRGHNRSLEDCFTVFGILHCLTDSVSAIETITRDVLQDFVADNVRYLELRTTPKVIPGKMTKEQYIEAVLNVMIEEMQRSNITVHYSYLLTVLVEISDAWDTLQIAKKYKNIIPNKTETLAILRSALIDRIGHGSYIHHESSGSLEMVEMVKQQNIPIEICVSSNIMSGTVKNVADHHFKYWRKEGHPIIICTDDKGVFNTSLSEEFLICAEAFDLRTSDLNSLCLEAVNSTFLPQEERERLHLLIQGELQDLQGKTTGKVLAVV
ncbi:adenosine deaminase-like protein [Macrobrachium nipponense]|uniref:adenosine deaminase-like protein n=1 Tax=Macrobrachium nipponense TaxID=159736 RepID=UPI0030C80B78